MAKRSPPASTISAETIASVSGILMVKVVPGAGHALQVDGAADLLDIGLHHVHADAAAGHGGDHGGGREAGAEDEALHLRLAHAGELGLGGQAVRQHLGADPVERQAAAVVGDLDDDVAAFVVGVQRDVAGLRLAGGAPLGRALQAVVAAVAHHVRQRVLDQLQHLAVELGLGAEHGELDLLVHLARQVAHQARQLVPGIADRLHARLHHAFLQVGGDVRQPLQRHGEAAVLLRAGELQKLVAGQHQLAHQRHQVFQHIHGDADGLVGGDRLARRRLRRPARGARQPVRLATVRAAAPAARFRLRLRASAPARPRRPAAARLRRLARRRGVQRGDQFAVVARRLAAGGRQPGHDQLDPVERRQHQA